MFFIFARYFLRMKKDNRPWSEKLRIWLRAHWSQEKFFQWLSGLWQGPEGNLAVYFTESCVRPWKNHRLLTALKRAGKKSVFHHWCSTLRWIMCTYQGDLELEREKSCILKLFICSLVFEMHNLIIFELLCSSLK